MNRPSVLLLGCLISGPVAGQTIEYRRSSSDTLRYQEVSTSESIVKTPSGEVRSRFHHRAILAIAFGEGDAATAWYETLGLVMEGRAGNATLPTSSLLKQPFVLGFGAQGHVELVSTPDFPSEIVAITDLSRQFDDLFLVLPRGPMDIGTEWVDTIISTRTADPDQTVLFRRINRKRVARDTTLGTHRGWVIESEQELSIDTEGPVPGQALRMTMAMVGSDTGIFVWDRDDGTMWSRRRTGFMKGLATVTGAAGKVELPQHRTYTNEVERR